MARDNKKIVMDELTSDVKPGFGVDEKSTPVADKSIDFNRLTGKEKPAVYKSLMTLEEDVYFALEKAIEAAGSKKEKKTIVNAALRFFLKENGFL